MNINASERTPFYSCRYLFKIIKGKTHEKLIKCGSSFVQFQFCFFVPRLVRARKTISVQILAVKIHGPRNGLVMPTIAPKYTSVFKESDTGRSNAMTAVFGLISVTRVSNRCLSGTIVTRHRLHRQLVSLNSLLLNHYFSASSIWSNEIVFKIFKIIDGY